MTVEVLWPAAFTIVADFTGRFTICTVIAVKAAIVAAATARFRNFGKVEGIVIVKIEFVIRIGLYRIDRIGVDLYTGRNKLDIAAPGTT